MLATKLVKFAPRIMANPTLIVPTLILVGAVVAIDHITQNA